MALKKPAGALAGFSVSPGHGESGNLDTTGNVPPTHSWEGGQGVGVSYYTFSGTMYGYR